MKRVLSLAALTILSLQSSAQQWASPGEPQKLSDIIAAYELSSASATETQKGDLPAEGTNYRFQRWKWYWEHHLDEQGYMVSPLRTLQEWDRFQQRKNFKAKITNQSQWTFQGPDSSEGGYSGIGRINTVAFHPADSNIFIIGSAGGGAWRTTNGGLSWTPLYNNLPVLGVSDIDYNPLNPNTIYLCTGDRDAADNYSVGVLKSYDGGANWNTTGLQFNTSNLILTNCLLVNPQDSNSLTLATSYGILKSYNGGASWQQTAAGNHVVQLVYHPSDSNILYAATKGMGTNQILRSADGGLSWTISASFPGTVRVALAVTPADANLVKAIVADLNNGLEGIYRSGDAGISFTRIFGGTDCSLNILSDETILTPGSCSGQGIYDLTIAISPTDTAKMYVGGVNMYQSLNGGYSWQIASQWNFSLPGVATIHADKHFHGFNPLTPQVLYEGNDGGIYKSLNPAANIWTDLTNGMGITQFYRNAVSDQAKFVLGGAQDNGSKYIRFNHTFEDVTGGDGMECLIDPSDTATFYTSAQNGIIYRITLLPVPAGQKISDNIPGQPAGAWITPYLLHPAHPDTIIAGYDHVYFSPDKGDNWMDISPGFNFNTKVTRLAMTHLDPNKLVALMGTSILVYTPNMGGSWQSILNVPQGTISDILLDPWDKDLLWVTYSGYGGPQVVAYHFNTASWTVKNDSLPQVPVNCVARDSSNGTLYVGTDVGVFYRDTTMVTWAPYFNGLPTVEVKDLGINYGTDEIWAATYGRGMWKSPRHQVIINSVSNLPLASDVISVSPNPNNGQFTISTGNRSLIGQQVQVRIVSLTGSTSLSLATSFDQSGTCRIQTSSLARGTYLVEIQNQKSIAARTKIVVQ